MSETGLEGKDSGSQIWPLESFTPWAFAKTREHSQEACALYGLMGLGDGLGFAVVSVGIS